jgi:hypothetical protein
MNSMTLCLGLLLTFAGGQAAGKVARRSRNASRLSAGIRQHRRWETRAERALTSTALRLPALIQRSTVSRETCRRSATSWIVSHRELRTWLSIACAPNVSPACSPRADGRLLTTRPAPRGGFPKCRSKAVTSRGLCRAGQRRHHCTGCIHRPHVPHFENPQAGQVRHRPSGSIRWPHSGHAAAAGFRGFSGWRSERRISLWHRRGIE